MAPNRVLVPLDGSPLADDALGHAIDHFDCPITVLNVVTPLDAAMSEGGVLEPGEKREAAAREQATRLIDRALERANENDQSVSMAVETGDPADSIVEYADSHGIDHIVMGGHGGQRGELTRRLLGTVSTAVVGNASVSVTVIR